MLRFKSASIVFSATAALIVFATLPARASQTDLYVQPGPIDAVNLLSRTYNYDEKPSFVAAVDDRLKFFEAAIANWRHPGAWPETKTYGERAEKEIAPMLEKARKALDSANSAGTGAWLNAQADSRRTLLELQRAYYDMHGNVKR